MLSLPPSPLVTTHAIGHGTTTTIGALFQFPPNKLLQYSRIVLRTLQMEYARHRCAAPLRLSRSLDGGDIHLAWRLPGLRSTDTITSSSYPTNFNWVLHLLSWASYQIGRGSFAGYGVLNCNINITRMKLILLACYMQTHTCTRA